MIGSKNLQEILSALDRQIGVQKGSYISLVVCGGTALAALELTNRTTTDVDVLAEAEETEDGIKIYRVEQFPLWLTAAAETVARDFGLPENWLNLGPASQVESGLPDGFESRLVKKNYGKNLTVYFTGRTDQIYFKLYAAVDRDDYILFSESNTRFLAEIDPVDKAEFERIMAGSAFAQMGTTNNSGQLEVSGRDGRIILDASIKDLKEAWQKPLKW